VQVIPTTMIAGMNPQCNAVLAMGAAFSQTRSAEAVKLPTKPSTLLIGFDGMPSIYNIRQLYAEKRVNAYLDLLEIPFHQFHKKPLRGNKWSLYSLTILKTIILHLSISLYISTQYSKCPKPAWYTSSWFSESRVSYQLLADDLLIVLQRHGSSARIV
jgi:hypothetical protein